VDGQRTDNAQEARRGDVAGTGRRSPAKGVGHSKDFERWDGGAESGSEAERD
jgi:hypothetical protein